MGRRKGIGSLRSCRRWKKETGIGFCRGRKMGRRKGIGSLRSWKIEKGNRYRILQG